MSAPDHRSSPNVLMRFSLVALLISVLAGRAPALELVKTLHGDISPKSIVYSGNGLFFAQNMMYRHTVTVYDREYRLVGTVRDRVVLSQLGYPKCKGFYRGAPVEVAFSDSGKSAWVSNYCVTGKGFTNPGNDTCVATEKHDNSFIYIVDTKTLTIVHAVMVGSVPKFLATTPDNRLVLVSNWCSYDLSVIDARQFKELRRVKLGRFPRGIAVDSASARAYVAVVGSYDVAVLDLKTFTVRWLRGIGRSPRHLVLDPSGKYLYATLNGEGKVAKVDLATEKVLGRTSTGKLPRTVAISRDGAFLYITNYGSDTVSKVRTIDMKEVQEVSTNKHPIGVTYDPETHRVWVACYSGSIMVFQD